MRMKDYVAVSRQMVKYSAILLCYMRPQAYDGVYVFDIICANCACGEGNLLRRLRMANEMQCIMPYVRQ